MRKFAVVACLTIVFNGVGASESQLPPIPAPIVPSEWHYVGPFSVGVRESAIEPTADCAGEKKFAPDETQEYRSFLVKGGVVKWRKITAEDGKVQLKYEQGDWDFLTNSYGVAGALAVGYAYCEFEAKEESRALAVAEKASSFTLNGKNYPGDAYGHGFVRVPVVLKEGKNTVLVRVGGFGDREFIFKLEPPRSAIQILEDFTLPDLIEGETLSAWVGITILNTSNEFLKDIKFIAGDVESVLDYEMPPLSVVKIPMKIEVDAKSAQADSEGFVKLPFIVKSDAGEDNGELKFRLRKQGESFKVTFLSEIDRSVQYYAVLPPKDFQADKKYPLILTLHGAGVEAQGQVDAYTQKDWAYVIAPTNRRPYGFDWQDWGRLDALEVLEDAKKRFSIDEDRIYLTGHSMGGHGVWHIGLTHPDLFAAIAPSAGWTSHPLYVPWTLQKSPIYASSQVMAIRDSVLRQDNPLVLIENAKNLPVFILQGAADDNVPAFQARMFAEELSKHCIDFVYKEVPEKGHWWDDEATEGADCVDYPEMMEFLQSKKREPFPKKFFFKTTDLGTSDKCYFAEIHEQIVPHGDTTLFAEISETSQGGAIVNINTKNIKKFSVDLSELPDKFSRIHLTIDGDEINYKRNEKIILRREFKKWRTVRKETQYKAPSGPLKRAFFSPFIFVYGTQGSSEQTENNLHKARLQAFLWWRAGNGFAKIIPDTAVNDAVIRDYNLILFGGVNTNSISARINKKLPIKFMKDGVALGKERFFGDNLAMQTVYPNPLNPKRLAVINGGTGDAGEKVAGSFGVFFSGAGLPDFLIYDSSYPEKLWGSVKAAGFFDGAGKLDEKNLDLR